MQSHYFRCEPDKAGDENDPRLIYTAGVKNNYRYNTGISDGISMAHDVLEHMPGKFRTLEDEIIAFGGVWFVRGHSGWFYRESNNQKRWLYPEIELGNEITGFCIYTRPLVAGPVVRKLPEDDVVESLTTMAESAAEGILAHAYTEEHPWNFEQLKTLIFHYLVRGYRSAERRLKHQVHAMDMFEQIRALYNVVIRERVEGARYRLDIDMDRLWADLVQTKEGYW